MENILKTSNFVNWHKWEESFFAFSKCLWRSISTIHLGNLRAKELISATMWRYKTFCRVTTFLFMSPQPSHPKYTQCCNKEIKKCTECIVKLSKHARFLKDTREVLGKHEPQANASHSTRVFLKNPKCLIYNSTMPEEKVFYFFYKMYPELSMVILIYHRLCALYLNSAFVWRNMYALWKYNELVLTNHDMHISLNILYIFVL